MSLTDHLRSTASPIRAYLDGASPWLADTYGSTRESQSMVKALGLVGLAHSHTIVPPLPSVDAARSGTAIDFRARIALGGFNPYDSIAAQGVALLPMHMSAVNNGKHRANVLAEAFDIAAQILDAPSDEGEIDRACHLLAYCEQVYRAGHIALDGSLGESLDAAKDGLAFALGIDGASLTDLRALMTANSGQIRQWRERIAAGERFDPNPSFSGSKLVGGADADWIIGDTLFESKAYATLTLRSLRDFLRQLLGYVMLDLDDSLHIRAVSVWFPRQGLTKTWALEQLLGGNPEELLPRLRAGFRSAVGNKQIATRELATQRRKHQLLAENKRTPHKMLVDLALSEDKDIRFRVGRNVATPEKAVRELARDRYARVREGVARNENAPADVLVVLAHDDSLGVRRAAAANPRTPKEQKKVIGTEQLERHQSEGDARSDGAPGSAVLAKEELRIDHARDDAGLDTRWFDEFLRAARGESLWGRRPRLPVPEASGRWALQEGRSPETPDWLKAGLPDVVQHDLLLEHRPARVRRAVAEDLPVSDPTVRDQLLTDIDPEIRWSALRRTVDSPDDSLAGFLGTLATDRKERIRFRIEGDGRSARERTRTTAEYDRETLSLVAVHPSTPLTALTEILGTKSPDVLISLVKNPVLPVELLTKVVPRLKSIRSHESRERLASSRRLPPIVARTLTEDRDPGVRAALAGNEMAPPEVIQMLSKDSDLIVRLAVVANPAASAELAATIIKPLLISAVDRDLLDAIRAFDGREDSVLPAQLLADALDRLSKSRVRDPNMRVIVATDERSSARTLGRLSRSTDDLVRRSVAKNPNTPAEALSTLATDPEPLVRASSATNLALEISLLSALAHDEAPEVRTSVARNSRLAPSLLAKLLRDGDHSVRSAAYSNPSTRPEDKVGFDADRKREWSDSAPSRADLVEMVASNRAEVRMNVAYDTRTPRDILSMLGGERRSARVRRAVAANPNTAPEDLAALADDRDVEVRQAVAFNSSTPLEVLVRLAGRSIDLALLVALNTDASVGILDVLADDAEPLVRFVAVSVRSERAALTMTTSKTDPREVMP